MPHFQQVGDGRLAMTNNQHLEKDNTRQETYMTRDQIGSMGVGSTEFYDPRTNSWGLYPPLGVSIFKCRAVRQYAV